jgi:hypothetical protein
MPTSTEVAKNAVKFCGCPLATNRIPAGRNVWKIQATFHSHNYVMLFTAHNFTELTSAP